MFPMETSFVALDNSGVLTVKLRHETSFVAYSTDKRSNTGLQTVNVINSVVQERDLHVWRDYILAALT